MTKHRPSLSVRSVRHLPPWLLPGYVADGTGHRGSGSPTDAIPRNWKDKYEIAANSKARLAAEADLAAAEAADLDLELTSEYHDCQTAGCQRVILNVSGQKFETQLRTLNRFPMTLLGDPGKRVQFWDRRRNEFFIDRHRPSFQAILYFYQSGGRLRRPIEVPEDIFLEELEFYQLGERTIRQYKEKEGFIAEKKRILPNRRWQRWIWLLCEEPDSSWAAKVFAVISVACIVISIVNFCMETLPSMNRHVCVNTTSDDGATYRMVPNYLDPFFIVETACIAWFTVEQGLF